MKLIIVRHGETEGNAKEIVQGQRHDKLTEKGIEQAKKLAQRLKDEKIDVIFCSDLGRAKETAKEIIKFHTNIPVHYTPEIRERAFGVLEGVAWEELRRVREKSGFSRAEFRPEGGENFLDIKKRVQDFLDKLFEKHKDKTVLVVSHGGVIRMFLLILLNKPIEEILEMDISNTCVNIIEVGDSGHKAHLINCIKHL